MIINRWLYDFVYNYWSGTYIATFKCYIYVPIAFYSQLALCIEVVYRKISSIFIGLLDKVSFANSDNELIMLHQNPSKLYKIIGEQMNECIETEPIADLESVR